MKRVLLNLAGGLLALLALTSVVNAAEFTAGKDYKVLNTQLKDPSTKGPFLMEYLWLGCPHCQAMNPLVKAFEESHSKVSIVRRPALGNDRWVFDAHVFYGLFGTGNGAKIYDLMNYYRDTARKERRLPDLADIKAYLGNHGVDAAKFEQQMDSDATMNKLSAAYRDQQSIGLKSVPVLLVNGKYQIKLEALNGKDPQARFAKLLDYLLTLK